MKESPIFRASFLPKTLACSSFAILSLSGVPLSYLREPPKLQPGLAKPFRELIEAPTFPEFLTLPAYDMIAAGVD